jgi:hypothetical protein
MKVLHNLHTISAGAQDYDITVDTIETLFAVGSFYLEDSNLFEINQDTVEGWPYDPVRCEVRGDSNFEMPRVDFVLNVGIKLREINN